MKTVLIAFSDDVLKKYQLKSKFAHNCIVTSSLSDLYTNLWQFKQAVILLEYVPIIPMTNNSEEFITKDMNPDILLFKILKLLKYKKILVTIEKIEKISNANQAQVEVEKLINFFFNDLDRQQTFERNIFGLENPKVQVIKKLKIEELNQFFHQEQLIGKNKIFETECLIISNEGPIHKVQILQGNLYKGQLLESNEKKVWIQTVEQNDKGFVFVSFEDKVEVKGLLFSPHNKPDIIKKIEVEAQLCSFDYYQLKDTFRKMGKLTLMRYNEKFAIENTNTNPIEFIGLKNEKGEYHRVGEKTFNMIKLEINIDGANFLNIQSESPMLFFQNQSDNILFFGRMSKIISSTKREVEKVYCFPLCTFQEQECENMKVGEKDLRYLCRICKQKSAYMIPNECGHLRYCDECIINCVDAQECFYCNLKITGGFRINKIIVDRQIYKKLKKENIVQQNFQSEILKEAEVPAFFKIIYHATKTEGIQNFYSIYCQLCNKNIIENYTRCTGGHITLICKTCQPKCTTNNCQNNPSESRMIVYEYCDDYYN